MQFRKIFLFSIVGLVVLARPVSAQEIITNDKGEKIIVYRDGSWKYFHKEEKEAFLFDETHPEKKEGIMAGSEDGTAVNQAEVSLKAAVRVAEQARATEKRLAREIGAVRLEKKKLEQDFDFLREGGNTPESEMDLLRQQLQEIYRKEEYLLNQYQEAERDADILEKMIFMKLDRRERLLANRQATEKQKDSSKKETAKEKTEQAITAGTAAISPRTPEKHFKEYDPAEDVMRHPPPPDCKMVFAGKDEFTGKLRREVAPQIFFSHTPDALRTYLQNTEYLTCFGYLISLEGGFRVLALEFIIVSPNAKRAFGYLPQSSILNIKLLDGKTIRLHNETEDRGSYNSKLQSYIYRGQYGINIGQEKLLRKGEVDKVRVVWSTGYEDYEVYEVDFFIDQFECLDKSFK